MDTLSRQLQDSTKVIKTQQSQITNLKQKLQKYKSAATTGAALSEVVSKAEVAPLSQVNQAAINQ